MWIMPTLSRPEQCVKVLTRILVSGCTSKGLIYINGKDHFEEYRKNLEPIAKSLEKAGWGLIIAQKNIGALGALNKCFELYPDEPWYGFIADDEFLESDSPSDWDQRLIAAAGDWSIAHGFEDWNQGKRCQGYPVFGGKLVRTVGYLALPTCWHSFGFDSMWEWLNGPPAFGGGGLHNLVLVPEVKIQHNRAKPDLIIDDCYKIVDERMEEDRKNFCDWITNDLKHTAERVIKFQRNKMENH